MIAGRCECSKIKYQIDSVITDFSHCHCSQCRRLHGAAFASFGGVKKASFSILCGQAYLANYASSDTHTRVFCRNCGSNILVALTDEPDTYYIAMGTIDGDPNLPTAYHIFVGSKAPWHEFHDTSERFDELPSEG